jgi:hypothetical protein
MRKLLRAAATAIVAAGLVLSGLAAGTASATVITMRYYGHATASTESTAEVMARSIAYAYAYAAGYPQSSCLPVYPVTVQHIGTTYTVTAAVSCTYDFPTGPAGQIVGVHSGKCLDVQGANIADGTPVQIYDCNGSAAQHWTIASDGTVRAYNRCLTTVGGGTANHTLVELRFCNGAAGQQWQRYGANANSLRNPGSGRCLDVLGFQTANGSRPGLWDCNGLSNQQWVLPV